MVLALGTDPDDPDTDGDGYLDGEEARLGTDPRSADDFPFSVMLGVEPGSDLNPLNLATRGVIPVAILGAEGFDVSNVAGATLRFSSTRTRPVHDLSKASTFEEHLEDVNADGFTDLVSHYRSEDIGIEAGDAEVCIT